MSLVKGRTGLELKTELDLPLRGQQSFRPGYKSAGC